MKTQEELGHTQNLGARERKCRETILVFFVEDKFDLDNAIQTKAEFSYAIAVMDKTGGWEEEEGKQENWVGPIFAASMWIFTKAVVCNGQNHMQNYRTFKKGSIMEVVNWGNQSLVSDGGQSSQDQWTPPNPCGKWGSFHVVADPGSLLKDKRSTCRRAVKKA